MLEIIIITVFVALIVLSIYRVYQSSEMAQDSAKIKQESIEFLAANQLKDEVEVTASGLQYTVLKEGEGDTYPTGKDEVKVHYEGTFIDGRIFDSSIKRGRPATFGLNQVIKGWTEGLQLMVVGEKRRFYIPPNLAYGNRWSGSIPPFSTLVFEVELLAIK